MACSKLEAMAIYLVKQACGNDILASVYIDQVLNELKEVSLNFILQCPKIRLCIYVVDIFVGGPGFRNSITHLTLSLISLNCSLIFLAYECHKFGF